MAMQSDRALSTLLIAIEDAVRAVAVETSIAGKVQAKVSGFDLIRAAHNHYLASLTPQSVDEEHAGIMDAVEHCKDFNHYDR